MKLLLAALACALLAALATLAWLPRALPAIETARPAPASTSAIDATHAAETRLEHGSAPAEVVPESGREPLAPHAASTRRATELGQGVHGSLRGPDGPLAGARLELRGRERALLGSSASGARGEFALASAEPVSGASLHIEAQGCAPLVIAPLRLARGEQLQLGELVLEVGLTLTGRVLGADHRPVPDAALALSLLSAPAAGAEPHARATSSATGEFRFEHVPRLRWRIEASAAGHGARALEGESAQASERLELVLCAPLQLELHAVDDTGAALPSARARLVPLRTELVGVAARADEHGRILYTELGGMEWRAQVEAQDHRSAQLYVSESMLLHGPVRVALTRWASVSGRVRLHAQPALAPRDVQLRARKLDALGAMSADAPQGRARTEDDGRFEISGLRPGRYRIEARAADCAPLLSAPFELAEAQRLEGVRLELEAGQRLELELRLAGAASAGAHVIAWSGAPRRAPSGAFSVRHGAPLGAARADEAGRVTLPHLPSAPLWLSVDSPQALPGDFGPYESPSAVPPVLELQPGATLALRALGLDGAPAAHARLTLERAGEGGDLQQLSLDALGVCEAPRLAPGTWTAHVLGACAGTAEQTVELVGGERLELDLQLR